MLKQLFTTIKQLILGKDLGSVKSASIIGADVWSSNLYISGILGAILGSLAGFFVWLTMGVLGLLSIKYREVCHRCQHGGGVFAIGSKAFSIWIGILGSFFIMISYLLTMAISSLSAAQYLSYVWGSLSSWIIWIAVLLILILGILNWVGISESALVSAFFAGLAMISYFVLVGVVIYNIGWGGFFHLFPLMFANWKTLTLTGFLVGFAGSFLAFSGLESSSQLPEKMKLPIRRTAGVALIIVVVGVVLTSPVLTMMATVLLPVSVLQNEALNGQLLSLLGEKFADVSFGKYIALNGAFILVFAVNTALIGGYHLLLAIAKKDLLPPLILRHNKKRGTPHYAILITCALSLVVLVIANGSLKFLGEMYAFGLLGAFLITSSGVDKLRYQEMKWARHVSTESEFAKLVLASDGGQKIVPFTRSEVLSLKFRLNYWVGIFTSLVVLIGFGTTVALNLHASVWGLAASFLGLAGVFVSYVYRHPGYEVRVFSRRYTFGRRTVIEVLDPNVRNGHHPGVVLDPYEAQLPGQLNLDSPLSEEQIPSVIIDDENRQN